MLILREGVMIAGLPLGRAISRLLCRLQIELILRPSLGCCSLLASPCVIGRRGWMMALVLAHLAGHDTVRERLLLRGLLHAIVDSEVVKLGQVLVHSQDLLMLDGLLHPRLRCIALLLLLDEFLNFAGVHARGHNAAVLHLAGLNDALDLGLDVAIC